MIESGTFPKIHDLKELFRNLRRPTKEKLKKRHGELTRMDDSFAAMARFVNTDLDSLLESGKDAFVLMRYTFEGNETAGRGFALGTLTACLREHILFLNPEWVDAAQIKIIPPSNESAQFIPPR